MITERKREDDDAFGRAREVGTGARSAPPPRSHGILILGRAVPLVSVIIPLVNGSWSEEFRAGRHGQATGRPSPTCTVLSECLRNRPGPGARPGISDPQTRFRFPRGSAPPSAPWPSLLLSHPGAARGGPKRHAGSPKAFGPTKVAAGPKGSGLLRKGPERGAEGAARYGSATMKGEPLTGTS